MKAPKHMTPTATKEGLGLRSACADALVDVLVRGASAPAALERHVYDRGKGYGERDRALAKEMVTGLLRWRGTLDALLRAMGRKKRLPFEDAWSLAVVHLGMYQILFMEKIPHYASVSSSVELIKARSGRSPASFVNAVLRRCAGAGSLEGLISRMGAGRREELLWASYPRWLEKRLERAFGRDEAFSIAMAMNERPRIFVRVDGMEPCEAAAAMTESFQGAAVSPGRWHPRCLQVERGGDLQSLDLFRRGRITVQDEGSQLAAHALGARPAHRVLDACCGMGIKAGQVALASAPGRLVAVDQSRAKLRMLRREAGRVGASAIAPLRADAARLPLKTGELFDRILVDAPCTGSGSLSRKPEIKARLRKSDPARLAGLQESILESAARHLKPDGILVYSVCSILPEEGEEVVGRFLERNDRFRALRPPGLPAGLGREAGGHAVLLLPHLHGTEGFFIAAVTR
jgi:16S rRNA (cytosine967-C5)-methyltransferase